MSTVDPLAPLAAADISANAATALVRKVLAEDSKGGDRVYRAFRAWCWKAMTERRYDSELRLWFDLLRKTSAALKSRRQPEAALKLIALSDMVYESIQFAEHEPVMDLLKRSHVRTILQHLERLGEQDKRALLAATGLKQANLSRVMSGLLSSGLVERKAVGREAAFSLARRGAELCRSLPPAPVPSSDACTETTVYDRASRVVRARVYRHTDKEFRKCRVQYGGFSTAAVTKMREQLLKTAILTGKGSAHLVSIQPVEIKKTFHMPIRQHDEYEVDDHEIDEYITRQEVMTGGEPVESHDSEQPIPVLRMKAVRLDRAKVFGRPLRPQSARLKA